LPDSIIAASAITLGVCFILFRKFVFNDQPMEEIIFLVEESEEGGFIAKGLGTPIFTQAETMEELRITVKDAVQCHFDEVKPRLIRLHMVREEVFAA